MKPLVALLCGIIFGFGLAISGMTDTAKVLGFLDPFGHWVPDLAFTMSGAVFVTIISFRFILRRQSPVLVEAANRTGRVTAIFATNVPATEAATLIKR
jgi:uncharacterized protein